MNVDVNTPAFSCI